MCGLPSKGCQTCISHQVIKYTMLKIYSKIIERCGSFELSLQRLIYRVVFLTGPPLKMSQDWPPPINPRLAPL